MQLEAVEPADRSFAAPRVDAEDAMLVDARRMADVQRRRVDEADAATVAQVGLQIDGQRQQHARQ
jgi:hypothetical protein